jgi:hypothetical protein
MENKLNLWQRLWHRCDDHDELVIEVLSEARLYNAVPVIALAQMRSGVIERRRVCKVACGGCGRVSLRNYTRLVSSTKEDAC